MGHLQLTDQETPTNSNLLLRRKARKAKGSRNEAQNIKNDKPRPAKKIWWKRPT